MSRSIRDAAMLLGIAIFPLAFSAWAGSLIYAQHHRLEAFESARATIESRRIEVREETGHRGQRFTLHVPVITYAYEVENRLWRATRFHPYLEGGTSQWAAQAIAEYQPGDTVEAHYDPENPQDAYLLHEYHFEPYAMFLTAMATLVVFVWIPEAMSRSVHHKVYRERSSSAVGHPALPPAPRYLGSPGPLFWTALASFASCAALSHYAWLARESWMLAGALLGIAVLIAVVLIQLSLRRAADSMERAS